MSETELLRRKLAVLCFKKQILETRLSLLKLTESLDKVLEAVEEKPQPQIFLN